MRIGVLVAFVLSSNLASIPCASAQAEPEAPNRQATSSVASPGPPKNRPPRWQDSRSQPARAVTEGGGSMNGPSRGESMSGMMRGPEPKQFYPTLIRIPDPTPAERKHLESRAQQWTLKGRSQLSDGAVALSESTRRDDVPAMVQAGALIAQGLSRLESGVTARRSLESGEPPPQVALEWFKTQLNLLPPQGRPEVGRVLGMAPFQLFLCSFMLTAIVVGLVVYAQRMRRASQLIGRIVAGSTAEGEAAGTTTERTATATPLSVPSPTAEPKGLLPIERKTLCRLRIARIYPETPDIKTFRLVSCDRGPIPFSYLPGQFLTLTLPIEGGSVKRSYTISSSPTQGYYCEISVKREDHGLGSRYLHDALKEGDTLEVRGPSGKLTFTGNESSSIVLIGGGVGVTPLMSVTRALADMGWGGEIILIVAFTDPQHFLFGAELERLKERNLNLRVHVAMSALEEDRSDFHRGRVTQDLLEEWIPGIAARPRIHLCASPRFMEAAKQMLADLGVPSERIKTESFGSQEKASTKAGARATQAKAAPAKSATAIEFQHSAKSTAMQADESVLEAAERIGVEINYSCRVGSCGECAVRLISGDVEMEVDDALEPGDKAAGIILACQAHAISDIAVES